MFCLSYDIRMHGMSLQWTALMVLRLFYQLQSAEASVQQNVREKNYMRPLIRKLRVGTGLFCVHTMQSLN
jgi:hypothetical protein